VEGRLPFMDGPPSLLWRLIGIFLIIDLAIIALGNRVAVTLSLASLMLALGGWTMIGASSSAGNRVRSYFGIYSFATNPGPMRSLIHGTTVHGLQDLRPGRETAPLSYYAPRSGVGLVLRDVGARVPGAHIGIVGLGTGTLACYTRPAQSWTFYEIDPAMARIALDPARFSFLSRCSPQARIKIGDARLTLAAETGPRMDVIVIDAFSSDSVPMHLLTREAFAVYQSRLAPGGILMMHVSNRYLRLEPVVAASKAQGWFSTMRDYTPTDAERKLGYSDSDWIALARNPDDLAALTARTAPEEWRPLRAREGFTGWTDDYASILPIIKWTKAR
jgi:hypothetical protein